MLVGSDATTFLLSERGNYQDFHLRIQAAVNAGGYGGVFFRVPESALPAGEDIPQGFYAQINASRTDVNRTGSLFGNHVQPFAVAPTEAPTPKANEWFDMEIIARGRTITVKINGQTSVDYLDTRGNQAAGHLALLCMDAKTVMKFRKIEIKELTPTVPGWVQLFNGKDLTGWKTHFRVHGGWKVEGGAIVSRDQLAYLFSDKGDYQNFHLRSEVKMNSVGDGGIIFGVPFSVDWKPGSYQAQLGLPYTPTGSLDQFPPWKVLHRAEAKLHKVDEWFVYEVVVRGNHIQILVNGKIATDYHDLEHTPRAGHVVLYNNSLPQAIPGSEIRFRKIEIKELPPTGSAGVVLLRRFEGYKEDVLGLAFSPDGSRALSSHNDGQVVLWDVASGTILKRMDGKHEGGAESVAFAPDGTWAISGGRPPDRSVRIWDLASGKEKGVIPEFPGPISRLIMFRDGKRASPALTCVCSTCKPARSTRFLTARYLTPSPSR